MVTTTETVTLEDQIIQKEAEFPRDLGDGRNVRATDSDGRPGSWCRLFSANCYSDSSLYSNNCCIFHRQHYSNGYDKFKHDCDVKCADSADHSHTLSQLWAGRNSAARKCSERHYFAPNGRPSAAAAISIHYGYVFEQLPQLLGTR